MIFEGTDCDEYLEAAPTKLTVRSNFCFVPVLNYDDPSCYLLCILNDRKKIFVCANFVSCFSRLHNRRIAKWDTAQINFLYDRGLKSGS